MFGHKYSFEKIFTKKRKDKYFFSTHQVHDLFVKYFSRYFTEISKIESYFIILFPTSLCIFKEKDEYIFIQGTFSCAYECSNLKSFIAIYSIFFKNMFYMETVSESYDNVCIQSIEPALF